MPGLVDGHVHPVFGEWTPTQDAIGWIGNYLHGGTTSMVSAGELHVPGLDYDESDARARHVARRGDRAPPPAACAGAA